MNILRLGDDELVPVDYGDLLDKILETLQVKNPFNVSEDRRRLLIDIDTIAADVAQKEVRPPLGSSEREAHSATVNFLQEVEASFPSKVRQIKECLQQNLELILGQNVAVEKFAASLTSPLESLKGSGSQLGLKYDFDKKHHNLQKKKLTLEPLGTGSDSLLKFHKVTVSVRNADIFEEELQKGLENYIDEKAETDDDKEALNRLLEEMVTDKNSDFHRLVRVVDKETLGQLKKEAKITYLEYILANISPDKADTRGCIYLEDLIRRLRLIEKYIKDTENKGEGDYLVNYQGIEVNYKDMFSRSEALDALPIIPIIAGNLGETTDTYEGDRQFVFGLKLKFGNPVPSHGANSVFDYNLSLLNPDSPEHLAALEEPAYHETFFRKVLKIAFLYYFVFASNSNPLDPNYNAESELDYDPIANFDRKVFPILNESNEDAKKELFRNFIKGFEKFNIETKINTLKNFLKDFIKAKTIWQPRAEARHILIETGILIKINNTLTTGDFFKKVVQRNPKETLQYISVGQPNVNPEAICQLPVNIIIEDVRYFSTDEFQSFSMEYNIKDIQALPILWVPNAKRSQEILNENFKGKLVVFPYEYRRLDSKGGLQKEAAFIYKFAVLLLSYICLRILLQNLPNNTFVPMVRIHEGDHDHPFPSEKFMRHLSKTLSHILSEKHRTNSQGFRIRGTLSAFKIRNGLSSLYSILPKKFRFNDLQLSPELDNLAIIAVSTRDSDARKGRGDNRASRKACLLGEVTGIRRYEDGTIQVGLLKTFSENYSLEHLYTQPSILEDIVSQLYNRGYRNFVYISQAPYMSTLHITQNDEDEKLFFMSKDIIRTLKGERQDIRIYPVFFDKYYVYSPQKHRGESFYIQDTAELASLFADRSKQAAMFFNLFNGIKVEQGGKNFYYGVISYSTLLNIYEGILDDQNIRQGLIYDGEIKDTLLHYLTIFHFSKYEARQQISLKLDPFDRIIGDNSVGALSEFSHAGGRANFNSLAFLNKVREVLNVADKGRT
ncbi:hypothetical protein QUA35_08270 [Microcoleus sp. N9_B2]|uniref:hypothetical protein n=1 Tax=unclassified Microcoleus TaxID=2642155 RepID=UPI002FCECBE7